MLFFACDEDHCEEASPPESTWKAARTVAREDGWKIQSTARADGKDYCPAHKDPQ